MTRSANLTAALVAVILTVMTFQQAIAVPPVDMPVTVVTLA